MKANKIDIYVYADWIGMEQPDLMGVLSAQQAKSSKKNSKKLVFPTTNKIESAFMF